MILPRKPSFWNALGAPISRQNKLTSVRLFKSQAVPDLRAIEESLLREQEELQKVRIIVFFLWLPPPGCHRL